MATFFADFFDLDPDTLEAYGAFNVSLVNDLPLFIDPFLLFNSKKPEYQKLHKQIIRYMIFLRDKAAANEITNDLAMAWLHFKEVKQNWLGFSLRGNVGSGLGKKFAVALRANLKTTFADFGEEKISEGSHLEKVCLIRNGVGKDNISDFSTNLIKGYLCEFTQAFALKHIDKKKRRRVSVPKAVFSYKLQSWLSETYELPFINGDYVLLTPRDILTRDENWINKGEMIRNFEQIPIAISNRALRGQVSAYFERVLVKPKRRLPTQKERNDAAIKTLLHFPELIDYYIKLREANGDRAKNISADKVSETEQFFIKQVMKLQERLSAKSGFYDNFENTFDECLKRLNFLKDVIENKGGHRFFYDKGKPLHREEDLQILYRLVWYGTPSDISREVNDGRGPVDFKASRAANDKSLVELKLAKNTKLEQNLENQVEIYKKASDAKHGIKGIIYFNQSELLKVNRILKKLGLSNNKDIVLIDARNDNKPSGSKAKRSA